MLGIITGSGSMDQSFDIITGQYNNTSCEYRPGSFIPERFILITLIGSSIALFGLISNFVLLITFIRHFGSDFLYQAVLAGTDSIVCLSYIGLFSLQILYDFIKSVQLYNIWLTILRPTFAVSHFSLALSTYMIVTASIERYLFLTKFRSRRSSNGSSRKNGIRGKTVVLIVAVLLGLATKAVTFFELMIEYKPNCTDFEAQEVRRSTLASNPTYNIYFMLIFRNAVNVFVPFILLVLVNGAIVHSMRSNASTLPGLRLRRRSASSKTGGVAEKSSVRRGLLSHPMLNSKAATSTIVLSVVSVGDCGNGGLLSLQKACSKLATKQATRTMVILVSTFLLTNSLKVLITLLEHFNMDFLDQHPNFYLFATDSINLLTVITCSLRFLTYYIFDEQTKNWVDFMIRCKRDTEAYV